MNDQFSKDEGSRLWRQAASGQTGGTAKVTSLELASWLDGQADAALSARVERALLADDALLETALAARAAGLSTEPAPERLLVRARAQVAHPAGTVPARGGFLSRLGSGWRRRIEWSAVAASLLIAASAGFSMGGGLSDNVALAAEPAGFVLLGDDETPVLFDGEI